MESWIEKRPEIRALKKWEAAWLAGVIDGEGSIGLYDYGREGRRVMVQLSNTSRAFVERAREVVGCGSQVNRTRWHRSHKGRRVMHLYSLKGSNRCYWLLKQILPFLIIKRAKAIAILSELERKPFGRWVNATPAYRRLHSRRLRAQWQNPEIRARRLAGLRAYYTKCKT